MIHSRSESVDIPTLILVLTGWREVRACQIKSKTQIKSLIALMEEEKRKVIHSGLRRKKTTTAMPGISSASKTTNVLDKFFEILSDWDLTEPTVIDPTKNEESIPLPNNYESPVHYIDSWEPLLIDETKAGILNTLTNKLVSSLNCVKAKISVQDPAGSILPLIRLECSNQIEEKSSESRLTKPRTHPLIFL
jgi:hypothetical protein